MNKELKPTPTAKPLQVAIVKGRSLDDTIFDKQLQIKLEELQKEKFSIVDIKISTAMTDFMIVITAIILYK